MHLQCLIYEKQKATTTLLAVLFRQALCHRHECAESSDAKLQFSIAFKLWQLQQTVTLTSSFSLSRRYVVVIQGDGRRRLSNAYLSKLLALCGS